MQMPWTTVEALTKDGNVPYQGLHLGGRKRDHYV